MLSMTYDELAQPLAAGGSVIGASELHGCVSGALCALAAVRPSDWIPEALPGHEDAARVAALQAALDELVAQTQAALAGGDLEFEPLLPPDDAPLTERVTALAAWCSGFLYGIGGAGSLGQPRGDVDEILRDFGEIARAQTDVDGAGEAGERDYTELVEFVRAAVQLAYEELAPRRAAGADAGARRPANGGRT